MTKADKLKKALADIDAKAARLAYARQQIQAKLTACEMRVVPEGPLAPRIPHISGAELVTDVSPTQMTGAEHAVGGPHAGYTATEVRSKVDGYLAEHKTLGAYFETTVKTLPLCVKPPEGASIAKIWSEFVGDLDSMGLSLSTWDAEDLAQLRDFLGVCFNAGCLMDADLPEGSTGN